MTMHWSPRKLSLHQTIPTQKYHCSQDAALGSQLHCPYSENGLTLSFLIFRNLLYLTTVWCLQHCQQMWLTTIRAEGFTPCQTIYCATDVSSHMFCLQHCQHLWLLTHMRSEGSTPCQRTWCATGNSYCVWTPHQLDLLPPGCHLRPEGPQNLR